MNGPPSPSERCSGLLEPRSRPGKGAVEEGVVGSRYHDIISDSFSARSGRRSDPPDAEYYVPEISGLESYSRQVVAAD